jgi:hypothetical protein
MTDPKRARDGKLEFPSLGIIIDRAGLEVDASKWTWTLNHAVTKTKLDFSKDAQ